MIRSPRLRRPARCRHDRNSWLIGAYLQWCYCCGAILQMEPCIGAHGETNCVRRRKGAKWIKPTGDPDNNPYSVESR